MQSILSSLSAWARVIDKRYHENWWRERESKAVKTAPWALEYKTPNSKRTNLMCTFKMCILFITRSLQNYLLAPSFILQCCLLRNRLSRPACFSSIYTCCMDSSKQIKQLCQTLDTCTRLWEVSETSHKTLVI